MAAETPRLTSESLSQTQANRSAERRRYFVAGAVACLVVQLVIVGGIAVTRYVGSAIGSRASQDVPADPSAALPPPVTNETVAVPAGNVPDVTTTVARAPAPATAPAATTPPAPTPAESVPVARAPEPVEKAPEPVAKTARAPIAISIPTAPRTTPPATSPKPLTRPAPPAPTEKALPLRPGEQAESAAPRVPVVGGVDWAESQSELRSALERWLIIEDRDDLRFAEAEVLLGPEGDTARTRVPSTRGGGKIIEQRWERRPNGWVIVGYREVTPTKQ
jgi:hypothetical protein